SLQLAPLSDGGEGLLDTLACHEPGQWRSARVRGIHGRWMTAHWYRTDAGEAVLESAVVLGLPLVARPQAPGLADRGSYALGCLIRQALDAGIRQLTIGLGGSACNDAGLGLLLALGATASDRYGRPVAPTMQGLLQLARLDLAPL